MDGVTSAAIGAISEAVIVLFRKSIGDIYSAGIALVTLLVLLKFKKIPEPIIVLISGGLGIILKFYIL